MRDGLRASGGGRLSSGIYLTDDDSAVMCIARYRAAGGGADCVVIDVEAALGHVKDIGHDTDSAGSWRREGYSACTSIHPPWAGSPEFREYCVADPASIQVIGVRRLYAWLSDMGGWSNPVYYRTMRAVPLGGKIYVFGRGCSDVHLASFDIGSQAWSLLPGLRWLADAAGWDQPQYYETIRVTPVGHKLYTLGRGCSDIHLASFDTASSSWSLLPGLSWLTDAGGLHVEAAPWPPRRGPLFDQRGPNTPKEPHYETIRVAATGQKLYVVGRGCSDIHLASFDTASGSWSPLPGLGWLADAGGWNQPQHYKTIRVAAIGQKLYVFARGCSDIHLASFDAASSSWSLLPGLSWLADAGGWSQPQHYETIRVAAIGRKLYAIARGCSDIHLASFDTVSSSWSLLPGLSWLADAGGWDQPQYYKTIRVTAIGERLYVFGRGCSDTHLASFDTLSNSWSFEAGRAWLADADGWNQPQCYETVDVMPVGTGLFTFGRGAGHLHIQCSFRA